MPIFQMFNIDNRYCERLKLLELTTELYTDEDSVVIHESVYGHFCVFECN